MPDMDYPANCRVLVLSTSLDLSGSLVRRITKSDAISDGPFTEWIISNKYYTAPVHFHRPTWTGTASVFENGTPAVLYVFNGTENYKATLQVLGQHLKAFDLEVMIAVSLPHEHEDETYLDTDELEELCSSQGFEYAEGTIHSIPGEGINRIVEALHTIMWPSMQQHPPRSPKRKAAPKLNILSKPSLENSDSFVNIEWTQFPTDEFQAEKIALEKWLDSGDSAAPVKVPTFTMPPDLSSSSSQPRTPAGFDDDFSDFVSAPAPAPASPTTESVSKSRVGEAPPEATYDQDHNDPEDDLFSGDFFPTDQEILMTSHRIFGPLLPSQRASSSRAARVNDEGKHDEGEDEDEDGDEDEDESDALPDVEFDLSKIMGALQGLKEEISGIEDEEAKRKMAAKVAMGLLYGLEG